MVFVKYELKDNCRGTLFASLPSSQTSITLNSGEGSYFPTFSTNPGLLTIEKLDVNGNVILMEKVLCTARSGDTLTVTRGQDGTTAQTFASGDRISLYVVAKVLKDMQDNIDEKVYKDDLQKQTHLYATSTGAANVYTISPTPLPTAYATGQKFAFKAHQTNTGASTFQIGALGVKSIKKRGSVDIEAGDIQNGQIVEVAYDGTNFQYVSPLGSAPLIDINGLTEDNNIGANDTIPYYQSGVGNKKRKLKATDTYAGIVEMATDAEATTGTDQERYINPKQLNAEITNSIGTAITLGNNTAYLASVSGFVVARSTPATNATAGCDVYSDGNTNPTTLVARSQTPPNVNQHGPTVCVPIKKGNYYKVVATGTLGSTNFFFYPMQ